MLGIIFASCFGFWFLRLIRLIVLLMFSGPFELWCIAWALRAVFVACLTGWTRLIALEFPGFAALAAVM